MKLIFSGKTKEFTPDLEEKFSTKLAKLSKLIERRGERDAHVMHQKQRHLHKVEVVMNVYDHALVGEGSDADLDKALLGAASKLEKQVLRMRGRWLDTHRDAKSVRSIKESLGETAAPNAEIVKKAAKAKSNGRNGKPKIFKINYRDEGKPMTAEEAILEIESQASYLVYRDSSRSRVAVLIRRADGNFDLLEL